MNNKNKIAIQSKGVDPLDVIHLKNVPYYRLQYEPVAGIMKNYGGFVMLFDSLVNYPELTLYDRLVYSALRNYSEGDVFRGHQTNVRNETIALRLGVSIGTVSKSISHLQSLGIIFIKKRPRKHERVISIVRDFKEVQPEQERYEEAVKKKVSDKTCEDSDDDLWYLEEVLARERANADNSGDSTDKAETGTEPNNDESYSFLEKHLRAVRQVLGKIINYRDKPSMRNVSWIASKLSMEESQLEQLLKEMVKANMITPDPLYSIKREGYEWFYQSLERDAANPKAAQQLLLCLETIEDSENPYYRG